jgi:hypothetical protein
MAVNVHVSQAEQQGAMTATELSGNCQTGENLHVTVDGTAVTAPRDGNGNWSASVNLSPGQHTVVVTCGKSESTQVVTVPESS